MYYHEIVSQKERICLLTILTENRIISVIKQKVYPLFNFTFLETEPTQPSMRLPLDRIPAEIRSKLSRIRMILFDVDGVLTDGCLRIDDNGVESKRFSMQDGFALFWYRKYGLLTGVISGRRSAATEARCHDLQMDEIHIGNVQKEPIFMDILKRRGLSPEEVAFVGDDIIDLPIMKCAGLSAAPVDAHPAVLTEADLVLSHGGGAGAARELLDLWMMATDKWKTCLEEIRNWR